MSKKLPTVRGLTKAYFFCFGAAGEPLVRRLVGVLEHQLVLRDDKAGTWSIWYLDEVVPVNCPAQELVAKLLWKKLEADFERWRTKKSKLKPSLEKCFAGIRPKIREWMKGS